MTEDDNLPAMPDNAPKTTTKADTMSAIHSLLDAEEPASPTPPKREQSAASEEADEDDARANYGDSEDASTEGDESDSSDTEEKPRYRLSDGSEVTLDEIEEWRKGNLRQSDYTRKTQELAAERKKIEARQSEIQQSAQRFDEEVNFAIAVAQQYLPQEPDIALMDTDPLGYLRQKETFEARRNELQRLFYAKQQNAQMAEHQQMQAFDEMKQREGEYLVEKRPHLKDPRRVEQFQKDILEVLPYYGYEADDLKSVYDHRLVMLIEDATAWRKLQKAKPKVQAKSQDAAPVPVVQPSGKRRSDNELRAQDRQSKRRELKKTGSKHIAAQLIKDML